MADIGLKCHCFDLSPDIECPEPPEVPGDPEYVLEWEDAAIFATSFVYPFINITENQKFNWISSWMNDTDIPRNYLANLT